jgi:hypothetical protein
VDNFVIYPIDSLYARVDTTDIERRRTPKSGELPRKGRKEATMALHTTHTEAVAASSTGALAGFEVSCSCGFTFRTAFAVTAAADAAEHVAYMAAKAQGPKALRAFVNRGFR